MRIFNLNSAKRKEWKGLVKRLAAFRTRKIECGPIPTDPPYAEVRLEAPTTGHVMNFDYACLTPEAKSRQPAYDAAAKFLDEASQGAAEIERTIDVIGKTTIG